MKTFHFILLLFLSSCITVAPQRTEDDQYETSGKYLKDVNKLSIEYIEVTAEDIANIQPEKIYLFATWCAPCLAELKSSPDLFKDGTMLVSINYNINSMEKHLKGLYSTIYILSNVVYRDIEKKKLHKFVLDLTGEEISGLGMPQHFHLKAGNYVRGK